MHTINIQTIHKIRTKLTTGQGRRVYKLYLLTYFWTAISSFTAVHVYCDHVTTAKLFAL